jgi:lipoate-protein ligase B
VTPARILDLGTREYGEVWVLQRDLVAARQRDEIPDTLVLVEHPDVITAGRSAHRENLLATADIPLFEIERGGDVTYHGPGQLVGYPIMRVGAIDDYLRTMEDAICAALAEQGIVARGRGREGADYTGVWVGERKIASIGVHVRHGIATHGFAVNVDNDLQPFSWVVACGLPGVEMTSIAVELGAAAQRVACFRKEMAYRFCQAHGRRARLVAPARLGIQGPLAAGARAREAVPV